MRTDRTRQLAVRPDFRRGILALSLAFWCGAALSPTWVSGQDQLAPPDSLPAASEAQVSPRLSGRVLDAESGLPLVHASILVQETGARSVSLSNGVFTLRRLPPAPFTLVVDFTGYETARRIITATDLATLGPIGVTLQPRLYVDDAVVVTASRYGTDVQLTATNITQQEIKLRNSDVSLPVLMEDTPGLFAYADAGNPVGYTYLKIRGFDQRRVGVLINGIPLNDPEDHQVYWVDLPDFEASLQDIQIQRGVSNSVGGLGALGGTVNLVTDRHPEVASGNLYLGGGSFDTGKQTLAYRTGTLGDHFSMLMRISHLSSDGFRDRSASDQWAVFWSGLYQTNRTSTQVNLYTGQEVTHQAWLAPDEQTLAGNRRANPEAYWNAIDNFEQPHVELHHDWYLAPRVSLGNSFYFIHGEGYYENFVTDTARQYSLDYYFGVPADSLVDVVQQLWVRKNQLGWQPQLEIGHRNGRLLLGGDIYGFRSSHWGDVMMAGGFVPADFGDGVRFHDFSGEKTAWSAFANERFEISKTLTLMVDLQVQHRRYDFIQNEVGNFRGTQRNAFTVDYEFFNPKAGAHLKLPLKPGGDTLGVYGFIGRNHLEPSLYDLYDTWLGPEILDVPPLFRNSRPVYEEDGQTVAYVEWDNPVVQPEAVTDYELGASFRSSGLAVTLNGYFMEVTNEIVPFGGLYLGYGIKGNAPKTYHRGIELDLRARLGKRHNLQLVASRSWDRYEEFIFYENVYDEDWNLIGTVPRDYAGNPIALFPEYLGSATWRSDLGALHPFFRLRMVGRQFLDNTNNRERTIDPYTVLDLGGTLDFGDLGWRGAEGARLRLQVRNVLDAEYETNGYYIEGLGNHLIPGAARNFWVAVEYDF